MAYPFGIAGILLTMLGLRAIFRLDAVAAANAFEERRRGEVAADQAPGGVIPGRTTIGIRPETLSVLFPGETTERRLADGIVDEVVYYGDMTYYDVRLPGIDQPLTISMKNLIGRPVLEVGAATQVVWDERSLVVLSR